MLKNWQHSLTRQSLYMHSTQATYITYTYSCANRTLKGNMYNARGSIFQEKGVLMI